MTQHFDPDPCRQCGGEGCTREKTDRGTWLREPCDACLGTGRHTVVVLPKQESAT